MTQTYDKPHATVDVVLLALKQGHLSVLLAKRDREPFLNVFALPGGYVHTDEDSDLEQTAARILRQKIGMAAPYLEQLYTFSGNARDPRGWSIGVAYFALLPYDAIQQHEERDVCELRPVDGLKALPFDHSEIINTAVKRLRQKSSYSLLPAFLIGDTFTMKELYDVYDKIGVDVDKVTFRRRIASQNVIEPVQGSFQKGQHRPAQLFRVVPGARIELSQSF